MESEQDISGSDSGDQQVDIDGISDDVGIVPQLGWI